VRTAAVLLAALACLAVPASAAAQDSSELPGETTEGSITSNGEEWPYLLYTPSSYSPRKPAPLLVMVHGCGTSAETEQAVTQYDALAEREGFVVLYPEVTATQQELPGPLNHCWKFWDPSAVVRGQSDPAAIHAMTRKIMDSLEIENERVYLAGISAGALMTSIASATYADTYAASAVMSSAGYADAPCFTTGTGQPAATSAQLAFEGMGPNARVVPRIVIGGDADLAFPWSCTSKALEQSLRTNNLVISGSQDRPISLEPATEERKRVPGGREYTHSTWTDPDGCLIGESLEVHDMGHFWSGGTTDPEYSGYNDMTGPDAAKATWEFFERFTKSETGMPCAESTLPRCPQRKVKVKLRKRLQPERVRAKVAGKRVPAKLRGRKVVVTLPAGADEKVRVRIRVRRSGNLPTRVVRRSFDRCAPSSAGAS
jgi:poly(hydroxyalkanoate) depolymerase family esterase